MSEKKSFKKWFKKIGWLGFLFFLIKGLFCVFLSLGFFNFFKKNILLSDKSDLNDSITIIFKSILLSLVFFNRN
jgi:hypothetical protein